MRLPSNKKLNISLDSKQTFDSKSIAYLLWNARLDHTGEAVERLRISHDSFDTSTGPCLDDDAEQERKALIMEHTARLMTQLGMIECLPEGIILTPEFGQVIKSVTTKRDRDAHRYNGDYTKFASVVALESLLIQARNSAPQLHGLPDRVLQEMHAMTLGLNLVRTSDVYRRPPQAVSSQSCAAAPGQSVSPVEKKAATAISVSRAEERSPGSSIAPKHVRRPARQWRS